MLPLTSEWVQKADGDFATMQRELRARKSPNYDSACFHAQQSVEKYLKALLQEQNCYFPRTHSLVILLELLLPTHPLWEVYRTDLALLTTFAIDTRYPGDSADKEDAKMAGRICVTVRQELRLGLGLTP